MSLIKHLAWLEENHPELRPAALTYYGSQNYGLDTEKSDTDTTCYLLPTWQQVYRGKKMDSFCFDLPNGEKCKAADFREIIRQFSRGSLNSIETLFSTKAITASAGRKLFEDLVAIRDDITMAYAPWIIDSAYHQAHANKHLKNSKQFVQCVRLCIFIKRFSVSFDFKKAIYLESPIREKLLNYRYAPPPLRCCEEIVENYLDSIHEIAHIYNAKKKDWHLPGLEQKLDDIIREQIERIRD